MTYHVVTVTEPSDSERQTVLGRTQATICAPHPEHLAGITAALELMSQASMCLLRKRLCLVNRYWIHFLIANLGRWEVHNTSGLFFMTLVFCSWYSFVRPGKMDSDALLRSNPVNLLRQVLRIGRNLDAIFQAVWHMQVSIEISRQAAGQSDA